MAFSDKNLGGAEALMRVAAGFVGMIIGLFIMVLDPRGLLISVVGLYAVGEGYYRWSLIRALRGGK
jgi:uncharacterized protein YqgC (DUF456 family)